MTKQQQKNIIILIAGFHTAMGWAMGTKPYNIVLSTQLFYKTFMFFIILLIINYYPFLNHW